MTVRQMTIVEAEKETDFEKLKAVFKSLKTADVIPIVIASVNAFKNIGEFAEASGNLEKKNKQTYALVSQFSEQTPEALLLSIMDKIPEDKLKSIVESTLKMSTIQFRMKDFKNLTADQKIKLGKEIKDVADNLVKTIGELPE
jgi:hypothetical protein